MTTEQKAKRYDEAIERAKDFYKGYKQRDNQLYADDLESVFPELKESEDDKIRKELISHFKETIENIRSEEIISHDAKVLVGKMQKWIAWLEKQGEHANFLSKIQVGDKVTRNEAGILVNLSQLERVAKPRRTKPANEVEPKFHEGDWAVSNLDKKARRISEVHFDEYNSYYVVDGESVNLEEYDRLHHLWSIKDAKEGDVLACENGCTNLKK